MSSNKKLSAHHIVNNWQLRLMTTQSEHGYDRKKERHATERNNLIAISVKKHVLYHRIFDGMTGIAVCKALPRIIDHIRRRTWAPLGEKEYKRVTMSSVYALFGDNATVEEMQNKIRFWVYYYLFKRDEPNASTHDVDRFAFTPEELMASSRHESRLGYKSRLQRIYTDDVLTSKYKREAWRLFFKDASWGEVALKDLDDVWLDCSFFQ